MENESITAKKNTFRLPFNNTAVELSGDFDSGNLNSVAIDMTNNVSSFLKLRHSISALEKIKMSNLVQKHGFISGYRLIKISKSLKCAYLK